MTKVTQELDEVVIKFAGDAVLCDLPKTNIKAVYEFLLRQNNELEGLTFSVKGQEVVLSLIIYDRYLSRQSGLEMFQRLFKKADDYDNILDGALAAGADLPFACKGGVCSTCKCRVVEGSVEMKINYALDEKEVAQQLVLSCQAVPTSEKVVVDFDV